MIQRQLIILQRLRADALDVVIGDLPSGAEDQQGADQQNACDARDRDEQQRPEGQLLPGAFPAGAHVPPPAPR